jgi:serine/threonine protein phosphatase 1
MSVTAVIGDVHGCIRTLDRLISEIEKRFGGVSYISLGDVIDRGPGICDVLRLFMDLQREGRLRMLRGNHEDVLIDFYEGTNGYDHSNWLMYGGAETLSCLSGRRLGSLDVVSAGDFIPFIEPYYDFLKKAEFKIGLEYGDRRYMLSHAGVGPSRGESHRVYEFSMRENYLFMWSRDTWRSEVPYFGYTMVHGHTPVSEIEAHSGSDTPFVNRNRRGELVSIGVDTGCVYGHSLSAMIIDESGEFDFISERNRG